MERVDTGREATYATLLGTIYPAGIPRSACGTAGPARQFAPQVLHHSLARTTAICMTIS
jgi:hypothetical protein